LISVSSLLIFSSGCVTRPVAVPPNPALTRDCDYPVLEGENWRNLAEAYEMRGQSLKDCTERMRAIRQ